MRAAFGIKLGRDGRSESIWGICADGYAVLAVEQICARRLQPRQASKPKTFHAELNIKSIQVMLNQTSKVFRAF
jgi:hypothetical protein